MAFRYQDLEDLRSKITDDQSALLEKMWMYFREHRKYIPTKVLHHAFGKTTVLTIGEMLGGDVFFENHEDGQLRYHITLLGILLRKDGFLDQELLLRFLRLVREKYIENPEIEAIDKDEIVKILNLTEQDAGNLRILLQLTYLLRKYDEQTWVAGVPNDVDDLPEVENVGEYLCATLIRRYDPTTPFTQQARLQYLTKSESKSRARFYGSTVPEEDVLQRKSPEDSGVKNRRVFIVHGSDDATKEMVARFLSKLGLSPIVLHEQPNQGRTIIEKFEAHSEVDYAVVLFTPDDVGHPKDAPSKQKARARQNVILELGFFLRSLGRSNVCVLIKGEVEIPSDYHGVLYVALDDGGLWQGVLIREMRAVGIEIEEATTEML